jgi:hypothetical protein
VGVEAVVIGTDGAVVGEGGGGVGEVVGLRGEDCGGTQVLPQSEVETANEKLFGKLEADVRRDVALVFSCTRDSFGNGCLRWVIAPPPGRQWLVSMV